MIDLRTSGLVLLVLALWSVPREAGAEDFQAGVFGDAGRNIVCTSGAAGDLFPVHIWARVPEGEGLAYLTLRLAHAGAVEWVGRPSFHPLVQDFIVSDFPGGSTEWNLVFADCPEGWVQVFTAAGRFLSEEPGALAILSDHSMARDCDQFQLNDLAVINDLSLNHPGCEEGVPVAGTTWDALKSIYR
jgi:hypothetical protein